MNQLELELQPPHQEYRTISLTQGQFAIVDAEDFAHISQWKWYAAYNKNARSFYAVRHERSKDNPRRSLIRMHNVICVVSQGMEVDHANHNTLDNRRQNLRAANRYQQCANRRMRRTNTSGFKGVKRASKSSKWEAKIVHNGKSKYLGTYSTKEAAYAAYKAAAITLHGTFACP